MKDWTKMRSLRIWRIVGWAVTGSISVMGYAVLYGQRELYETRPNYFQGTMVTITLRCDERHYSLIHEKDDKPLF